MREGILSETEDFAKKVGNLTLLSSAVREGILYSVRLRSAVGKRGYSSQLHQSVKIG